MQAALKKLRPVDLLPLLFLLTVAGLTLLSEREPRIDREKLGAWGVITFLWMLIVALPSVVRFELDFLKPKFRNLPGHVVLILLAVVLLFTHSLRDLFDPIAIVILSVIVFLVHGLGRRKKSFTLVTFLYEWSPLIISFYIYENLRWFVSSLNPRVMDDVLARIDLALFGIHLSLVAERYQSPWLSEWFSFHYAAYVLYPVTTGMLLYYTDRKDEFEDFVLAFGLSMYIGFIGYLLVPAVGPISGLLPLFSTPTVPGMDLTAFQETVVEKYRYIRDAFPSLHAANSLLCVLTLRKPYPRLFRFFVFMEINLLLSTIYLRMHYTIDVVAGLVLGSAAWWAAPRINALRYGSRRQETTARAETSPQ